SFQTPSEARGKLGLATGERRVLIVLDDVWEPGAADPFTPLGPECRVLITSRDLRVIERVQATAQRLDLLDTPSARAFLAQATGLALADIPGEADAIVAQCGRLPLALAAVGALIRDGTFTWPLALAALRKGAALKLDTSWLPDPEQRT